MGLLTNNWGMMDYSYEEMASESKLNIIRRIIDDMKPYLNQRQITELNQSLMFNLEDVELVHKEKPFDEDYQKENKRLFESFLDSKKLEGRSDNTLHYYRSTLAKLLSSFDKPLQNVTTLIQRNWCKQYNSKQCKKNIQQFLRLVRSRGIYPPRPYAKNTPCQGRVPNQETIQRMGN